MIGIDLNEYQSLAFRTCKEFTEDYAKNLAHMTLGMCSELEEFVEAIDNQNMVNLSEELSDIYWYIAGYCTFRNYKLQDIYNMSLTTEIEKVEDFFLPIYKLSDIAKKAMVYNKEIDIEKEQNYLIWLVKGIDRIASLAQVDTNVGLTNNINKLKIRFPEKYSDENAINRNLEQEYESLKQNV